jgi:hypothetical protein
MSKNINVNPDHYKVRGRERPDTLAAVEQQRARKERDWHWRGNAANGRGYEAKPRGKK